MAAHNAECRGTGVSFVSLAVEVGATKQPYKCPSEIYIILFLFPFFEGFCLYCLCFVFWCLCMLLFV